MVRMDLSSVALDHEAAEPLYRQLCEGLAGAIARGELRAGERLPSERALAGRLGVSRTTAVNAYRELAARGLVRGHVGRGTVVCAGPDGSGAPFAWRGKVALAAQRTLDPSLRSLMRQATDPGVISFAAGTAALDRFPDDLFRELTDRALRGGAAAALGLGPTEGHPAFRRAIAARARARPEEVLILTGAQQGLDLVARCLLDPGDAVVLDRPGYLGAIQTFRAAGARLVGWEAARGDLEELEDLLLRYRPKFLYLNPTFQNPTGRTLPVHERRELLALAARYRLPVVEDEPYRELSFASPPPPSLRELDEHRLVIHLATFSKTLAPGLRLGWLAASEAIVDQLALIKQRADIFSPSLAQLVVAELLRHGHYDAHLRALRAEHARRHEVMLAALRRLPPGALTCTPVAGGLYLWCRLPSWHGDGLDSADLLRRALARGVAFVEGERFYPDGAGRHELRLCFSGQAPAAIEEGVRRLAGALGEALEDTRRREVGTPALV